MIIGSHFLRSSIGRKSIVAVTGLGLILFLIVHMLGNLLIFQGPDAINAYGVALRATPILLWIIRGGLLVFFLMHVALAVKLNMENRAARPVGYSKRKTVKATFASRSMLETGLIVLFFLIYHLLHYTLGLAHTDFFQYQDAAGRHDVYRMVILSFQQPLISGAYIVAMVFLALHLSHALPALFQTLGWNAVRFETLFRRLGVGFAIFMFLGFISIPVCVMLGMLR